MTESELLFTEVLNCDRPELYFQRERRLTPKEHFAIFSAFLDRISFKPLQHILGKTEFMGLEFEVNKDVLIPRPETEILVEAALRYAGSLSPDKKNILDLGTGSGCIAVSLAKHLPDFRITAVDISLKALMVARKNAVRNAVSDRITFIESDLYDRLSTSDVKYSLCVSNPPYIASREIDSLQPEIRYEPRIALDGGIEGLEFYPRIIKGALSYLDDGGILLLEAAFNQREEIESILESLSFCILERIKDYNNLDRVIVARKGR